MYPTLVNNAQASCLCSGMYLARKASTMVHWYIKHVSFRFNTAWRSLRH
jgi:hypothetical protein